MVRYTVKPEQIEANTQYVEAVFAQLARERPAGLRYATFTLGGGGFVHLASVDATDGPHPLTSLDSFKRFVEAIRDRCSEPPVTVELAQVGSYRMFDQE